jgi:hypothetical protein
MGAMLAVLAACIDPVAYGAVPNDGKPDQAAIQRAIDAAEASSGEVCLGRGTFELERPGTTASLLVAKGDIVIRGAGPETVLNMVGDGKRAAWYGMWIKGASNVTLRDLTFTATGTTNTKEQTHVIQIGPASTHITVDHVRFGPMRRPDQRVGEGAGGDCIRLLGEPEQMVEDVVITHSSFVDCDRSGIGVQRGVRRVTVAYDTLSGIGDTPIDFEPSAPGPVEDLAFVDLKITRTPDAQGPFAMTIDGYGTGWPARRVVVVGCDISGGGIGMLNADDVVISDNHIRHGPGVMDTVHMMRLVTHVVVANNTIERPATSPPGGLIGITHNNGVTPFSIRVTRNELVQHTDFPIVSIISASSVEVRDNHMTYDGSAPVAAIDAHAVIDQIDDLDVIDNLVDGPVHAVVQLAAQRLGIGRVSITRNHAAHAATSVVCVESAGRMRAPVQVDGNDFGAATASCRALPPPTP